MSPIFNLKLEAPLASLPGRPDFFRGLSEARGALAGVANSISWVSVEAPSLEPLLRIPGVLEGERDTGCDRCNPICAQDLTTPWHMEMVNAELAHTVSRGSGSRVAVIDTGISPMADLARTRIVVAESFVPEEGVGDTNGHGSASVGLVGGQGPVVYGVAPEADILVLKALDRQGRGRWSWIALAIERAADLHADVVVMALGGGDGSHMVEDALQYLTEHGGLPVTAAGNGGTPFLDYPGASAYAITVAAVDCNGKRPSWSSWAGGDRGPDCSAPGVNVPAISRDGYKALSGTSMATAVAGGIIALARMPKDLRQARRRIHEATVAIPVSREKGGYGLLDAALLVGASR